MSVCVCVRVPVRVHLLRICVCTDARSRRAARRPSTQYDVILGPPGTERAIDKLKWSGAATFAKAPTFQVRSQSEPSDLAGYARQAHSSRNTTFSYVMLRGCGHMVPSDQPVRAYTMLEKFLVPMAPLH